jgi:1-deoxy-D-xylulose-5-phosphate synthase
MISGTGSTLFEELGLYYIGPVDGHNLDDLIAVLNGRTRNTRACTGDMRYSHKRAGHGTDCLERVKCVLIPVCCWLLLCHRGSLR